MKSLGIAKYKLIKLPIRLLKVILFKFSTSRPMFFIVRCKLPFYIQFHVLLMNKSNHHLGHLI